MPPTYRERLRVEGLTLAGCALAGSLALLALAPQARRSPLSTVGQLAVLTALLSWLGPRSVRRAMEAAGEVAPGGEGSGEPTPLWQLPLIVAGLALIFPLAHAAGAGRAGWDASLRVTGGCLLVGLAQAVVLERLVAADERAQGRSYLRLAGSRIARGTVLGFTRPR